MNDEFTSFGQELLKRVEQIENNVTEDRRVTASRASVISQNRWTGKDYTQTR